MTNSEIVAKLIDNAQYDPLLAYQLYLCSCDGMDLTPVLEKTAINIGQLLDDNPDYKGGDVWIEGEQIDKVAEITNIPSELFVDSLDALGLFLDVFMNNGTMYYGYDSKTLLQKKNYMLKQTPILGYAYPKWEINNEN